MKTIKNWLIAGALFCLAAAAQAASITGDWRTIDDETGKPKAVVRISEDNGVFNGTIISMEPGTDVNCEKCEGPFKGKSLIGTTVLKGLRADKDQFTGGNITDPKTGKVYKAKAKVTNDGKSLEVRGFIGISLLGRTQTWQRIH